MYRGQPLSDREIENHVGFVYIITCSLTSKKYVGKKIFQFARSRRVKRRTNRIRYKVESDWRTYYGSNKELIADVAKHGEDKFTREVLHLCQNKWECSYLEAQEQFARDALLRDDFYNAWIRVRVARVRKKIAENAIST